MAFAISTSDTTELGNLSNGDVVDFRFYFSDSNSHGNAYTHRLDDIQLYGTINPAVPEPASCALVTRSWWLRSFA